MKIISGRYHFQIGFTESHGAEQNDKDKGRDEEGVGSGKIKKSKEIRKGPLTLTFSGGWVNNARGTQPRRAGMDSQSAIIKRHGCVYSGICLFPPFPPLNPDAMRFLSYFSTTIPPGDLYTFSSGSKRRACERQKKTEGGERETSGRRSRKNHDAIIFVPARERILRPSDLDRWTEEEKKEHRKAEGQKKGLTSSSGRVRDKDVKVVEGDEIYCSEIWGEMLTSSHHGTARH